MATPTIHVNPVEFDWANATTNTDGTPITADEITGYVLGIRATAAAGSVAGTYPIRIPITDASAAKELMSAITPVLAPAGSATVAGYAAGIMSNGPVPSAWNPVEYLFSMVPPTPKPPSFLNV